MIPEHRAHLQELRTRLINRIARLEDRIYLIDVALGNVKGWRS